MGRVHSLPFHATVVNQPFEAGRMPNDLLMLTNNLEDG